MNAHSLLQSTVASDSDLQVQDEWGVFDPQQAGAAALSRTMGDSPAPASAANVARPADTTRHCRFCTETLLPGARQCPLCLRDVGSPIPETRERPATVSPLSGNTPFPGRSPLASQTPLASKTPLASMTPLSGHTPLAGDTPFPGTSPVADRMPAGAVYTLESPARCPECDKEISTLQVLRVLRTQVSFTSTLPRKAYVIACPECNRLLSAGFAGIL